jgi:hypothetical protein
VALARGPGTRGIEPVRPAAAPRRRAVTRRGRVTHAAKRSANLGRAIVVQTLECADVFAGSLDALSPGAKVKHESCARGEI